jgi:hypothetical protein
MYTVRISRTTSLGTAAPPSITGVQYASLSDFTAAMRGELPLRTTTVSYRRCRTLPGAWWQTWRARWAGNSASIIRRDQRAEHAQMLWRAIAGLPDSGAD